ncbi:hypothetical protein ABW21_db0200324 [Orbilia brochopaga]|nr:hypothetical protein ABW21_db0200324 [Drechslerella brochopaga]
MFLGSQYKALQAKHDRLAQKASQLSKENERLRRDNERFQNQCDIWERFIRDHEMELARFIDKLYDIKNSFPDLKESWRLKDVKAALRALAEEGEGLTASIAVHLQMTYNGEEDDLVDLDDRMRNLTTRTSGRNGSEAGSENRPRDRVQRRESRQPGGEVDDDALPADFAARVRIE